MWRKKRSLQTTPLSFYLFLVQHWSILIIINHQRHFVSFHHHFIPSCFIPLPFPTSVSSIPFDLVWRWKVANCWLIFKYLYFFHPKGFFLLLAFRSSCNRRYLFSKTKRRRRREDRQENIPVKNISICQYVWPVRPIYSAKHSTEPSFLPDILLVLSTIWKDRQISFTDYKQDIIRWNILINKNAKPFSLFFPSIIKAHVVIQNKEREKKGIVSSNVLELYSFAVSAEPIVDQRRKKAFFNFFLPYHTSNLIQRSHLFHKSSSKFFFQSSSKHNGTTRAKGE